DGSVGFDCSSCLSRDIGKRPVFVIVIERHHGLAGLLIGPGGRIDQQDVLPTIVIVVEETATVTHGFRQILLTKRTAVMFEMNAGRVCYVRVLTLFLR